MVVSLNSRLESNKEEEKKKGIPGTPEGAKHAADFRVGEQRVSI